MRDSIVFTCLFLFMMFNLRVYRDFVRFRNALIEEISVLTGLVVNYGVWAVKFGMILFFFVADEVVKFSIYGVRVLIPR